MIVGFYILVNILSLLAIDYNKKKFKSTLNISISFNMTYKLILLGDY